MQSCIDKQEKIFDFTEVLAGEPDHIVTMDVATVKTLQIGYQAETLLLKKADDDMLTVKEYIGGLSGTEYYAKITANRFKTTIRYGRRENVNLNTCVEVFLPESYHGELQLSSQYGSILTEDDWNVERFAAETTDGSISLQTIAAPRIRLASSVSPIHIVHAIGFTDIHSVSGTIMADAIDGGARLGTSSSEIRASFYSLNNIVECETLNGNINLALPNGCGMKVDGVSKRGNIASEIDGLTIKTKPGNIRNVTGLLGEKPFQNIRISAINGNIALRQSEE